MRPEHWLYTIPLWLRSLFRWAQADQEVNRPTTSPGLSLLMRISLSQSESLKASNRLHVRAQLRTENTS